jgi:hypothetical protein
MERGAAPARFIRMRRSAIMIGAAMAAFPASQPVFAERNVWSGAVMSQSSAFSPITQSEAVARIQDIGCSNVTGLRLDESGAWRAAATRNGRLVNVTIDRLGNILVE